MEIPQIHVHEAKQKLDAKSCLFVDIRDPGSYRQAHIPGAIQLNDGNVQEFLQNTAKEQDGSGVLLSRQQQSGRDRVSHREWF